MLRSSLAQAILLAACLMPLRAQSVDPFLSPARVRVLLFVRTDCPITNRYAPELHRIGNEFKDRGVTFWMVYPDPHQAEADARKHTTDYDLPGTLVLDPQHKLVARAHATIAPEAAVFDANGALRYHGRIDDLYVDIGRSRPAPRVHDLEDAIRSVMANKPVAQTVTQAVGCSLADIE